MKKGYIEGQRKMCTLRVGRRQWVVEWGSVEDRVEKSLMLTTYSIPWGTDGVGSLSQGASVHLFRTD